VGQKKSSWLEEGKKNIKIRNLQGKITKKNQNQKAPSKAGGKPEWIQKKKVQTETETGDTVIYIMQGKNSPAQSVEGAGAEKKKEKRKNFVSNVGGLFCLRLGGSSEKESTKGGVGVRRPHGRVFQGENRSGESLLIASVKKGRGKIRRRKWGDSKKGAKRL